MQGEGCMSSVEEGLSNKNPKCNCILPMHFYWQAPNNFKVKRSKYFN